VSESHLQDGFGRIHDDLRVSVTDRCNLRCVYCMPEEPTWFPREDLLTYEEIETVVRAAVSAGVRKVRITGGEPLVRRDVHDLVRRLSAIAGIEDLSLTTNGLLLADAARALRDAGLHRVNVSLDTLDPDRFRALTRRAGLDRVLAGLDAAVRHGLGPVKVNTVLLRGVNDDEIEPFVEQARDRGWEVRFIEFMPLENGDRWNRERVVTGEEVRRRIAARWPIDPDPEEDPRAPARRFRFRDGGGRLGFIDSVTRPFCGDCGRLRLTSDGRFRVCLYDDDETDLRNPVRAGESGTELVGHMLRAIARKGRGGALDILERREAIRPVRTMHQIGG
jgi:cyclic pyranopterin phosphate synthase